MIELCSYLYFQILFTFLTVWFISKTGERENKSHFLQMALQVNLIDLLNILIEHHKANILRSDNMAPKTHKKSNPGLRSSRGLREHRQPLGTTPQLFLLVTFYLPQESISQHCINTGNYIKNLGSLIWQSGSFLSYSHTS